jgi:hypothetical protein
MVGPGAENPSTENAVSSMANRPEKMTFGMIRFTVSSIYSHWALEFVPGLGWARATTTLLTREIRVPNMLLAWVCHCLTIRAVRKHSPLSRSRLRLGDPGRWARQTTGLVSDGLVRQPRQSQRVSCPARASSLMLRPTIQSGQKGHGIPRPTRVLNLHSTLP